MKNQPWYVYLFLAIFIFGLFYLLYFKPKNAELKDLREERIKAEGEVIKLRAKKDEVDQIEAELKHMNLTLKELEAIIPPKLSHFSRLFNIEKFSKKSLRNQTEASTISANFTAKTYIFREETVSSESNQKKSGKKE